MDSRYQNEQLTKPLFAKRLRATKLGRTAASQTYDAASPRYRNPKKPELNRRIVIQSQVRKLSGSQQAEVARPASKWALPRSKSRAGRTRTRDLGIMSPQL